MTLRTRWTPSPPIGLFSIDRSVSGGFYGSLVVHLITAGWFASHRSLTLGIPFIVVGVVLFHLPALYSDRFIEESGS